jgi:NDP-sugar pyrophosphorylase family protein
MSKCAVILAGGKGTRLKPFTISIPKPLVPVGDKPILEHLIKKLADEGFTDIIITVNHLAELIKAFFGDGSKWGISIKYSIEDKPLSTMGPIRLIDSLPEDFLILNGDVLTNMNFNELFSFHTNKKSLFTIASHLRKEKIDYGVLEIDHEKLKIFNEKPEIEFRVSMGIYAANRRILQYIPENKSFGFDDLMLKLLSINENVNVFTHDGYWLDIGRPDDYEKAINDFAEGII